MKAPSRRHLLAALTPGRRQTRAWLTIAAVLVATTAIGALSAAGAQASVGTETYNGFDDCSLPSTSAMSTWWADSPYFWIGAYLGGADLGGGCSTMNSSWVSSVTSMGWGIEPIWVGPQDPCWGGSGSMFSTNTSTAYSQGEGTAENAISALANDGFNPSSSGNDAIVYDLEAYNTTGTCVAAAQAFIAGWDYILGLPSSQVYGTYGSSCASDLQSLTSSNPIPKFIWGADWDNNPNTSVIACVSSWTNSQRLKQYWDNIYQTFGGVQLHIDQDSANGPVYF